MPGVKKEGSDCDFRFECDRTLVASAREYKGLAVLEARSYHAANKYAVVAAFDNGRTDALEVRDRVRQNRTSAGSGLVGDGCELVRLWRREMPAEVNLISPEHIHREMRSGMEGRE